MSSVTIRRNRREESPNMKSFNTGNVSDCKSCALLFERAKKNEENLYL